MQETNRFLSALASWSLGVCTELPVTSEGAPTCVREGWGGWGSGTLPCRHQAAMNALGWKQRLPSVLL